MGLEYGPCGPDSEMFYIADKPDCGPDCGPGCDCGKYTELGNDVFMQYEKHQDGSLTPLSQKNVDTGWGLERILAFLNGTKDVYQVDVFVPAVQYIEKNANVKYNEDEKTTRSIRILADHIRTSVMLIGDEKKLLPSNTGAGYILRRLIRRAVRHARALSLNKDQILGIAAIFIDEVYAESYPLLVKNREYVLTELSREIARFESTLENGMKEFKKILDKTREEGKKEIGGKDAFFLFDTYGFPVELTVELAEEEGLLVDEKGFAESMEEQKQKARDNQNFSANLDAGKNVYDSLDESVTCEFVGYTELSADAKVVAMASENGLADELSQGTKGSIITDKTPFYGTMGGQIGDIGTITTDGAEFKVEETIHVAGGRIAHVGQVVKGSIKKGDAVNLSVDTENRAKTCRNHSATHLLQKALREVLGDHVEQAGSYQDPDKTRFDFSHHQAMTAEELQKVEDLVNEKIAEALPVVTQEMSMEEAKKTGAMALFGEKYGDVVRVVKMGDFSTELCGGTHVANTSHVGIFKIVSESGVAAGVRRIEALTGSNAREYYKNTENKLNEAAKLLKSNSTDIAEHIKKLQDELKALKSENESLKSKEAQAALGDVTDKVEEVKGVKLLAVSLKGVDMNGLRDLGDQMKTKIGEGVVVLISECDGKVNLVTMATDDAMAKGAHAGNLVKAIAPKVGGGGGGRPNMAQAGGKNPAGIADAIAEAKVVLEGQIG